MADDDTDLHDLIEGLDGSDGLAFMFVSVCRVAPLLMADPAVAARPGWINGLTTLTALPSMARVLSSSGDLITDLASTFGRMDVDEADDYWSSTLIGIEAVIGLVSATSPASSADIAGDATRVSMALIDSVGDVVLQGGSTPAPTAFYAVDPRRDAPLVVEELARQRRDVSEIRHGIDVRVLSQRALLDGSALASRAARARFRPKR